MAYTTGQELDAADLNDFLPNNITMPNAGLLTLGDVVLSRDAANSLKVDASLTVTGTNGVVIKRKTADESVTSSTTLQNDDHILFTVVANAVYALDGYLVFTGAADTGGGLKIDWTIPSGASMTYTYYGANSGALTSYDVTANANTVTRTMGTNSGQAMSMQPRGFVAIGGTGGTLQMRWAQGTSNATATVIKQNSWVRLTRMA